MNKFRFKIAGMVVLIVIITIAVNVFRTGKTPITMTKSKDTRQIQQEKRYDSQTQPEVKAVSDIVKSRRVETTFKKEIYSQTLSHSKAGRSSAMARSKPALPKYDTQTFMNRASKSRSIKMKALMLEQRKSRYDVARKDMPLQYKNQDSVGNAPEMWNSQLKASE